MQAACAGCDGQLIAWQGEMIEPDRLKFVPVQVLSGCFHLIESSMIPGGSASLISRCRGLNHGTCA